MNDLRFAGSWYVWRSQSIYMKEFQTVLDGYELFETSHWHVSFDVVPNAFCLCISSKVKIFCSLSVHLGVHMFGSWDQVAIVLQL